MEHSEEERLKKIDAFIYNLERLLKMEQDSMKAGITPIFKNDKWYKRRENNELEKKHEIG